MGMAKPAIVLFLVTLIAGLLLGGVNSLTYEQIELQKQIKLESNLRKIFPEAESFSVVEEDFPNTITKCFQALKGGQTYGFVIQTEPKGYGGTIEVLTGIDAMGNVVKVQLGTQSETPGLGANAKNEKFLNQYMGKTGIINVVKQLPKDDEIEAITSATITSKAVTDGVNDSLNYFKNNLEGGGK